MTPPIVYVDPPDVPEGMTLDEYRRLRTRPSRGGRLRRITRRRPRRRAARRRRAA